MTRSKFSMCRVCLKSSSVANLRSLFDDKGGNAEKIKEISGVDIFVDRDRNEAFICSECTEGVAKAHQLIQGIRSNEKNVFSRIRQETEKDRDENKAEIEKKFQEFLTLYREFKESLAVENSRDEDGESSSDTAVASVLPAGGEVTEDEIVPGEVVSGNLPPKHVESQQIQAEVIQTPDAEIDDRLIQLEEGSSGNSKPLEPAETIQENNENQSLNPTPIYKTPSIPKKFSSLKRFALRAPDDPRRAKKTSPEVPMVECLICSKKFFYIYTLKHHIERIHENKKNFKCEFCPLKFFQKQELRSHLDKNHLDRVESSLKGRRVFKCKVKGCNMILKTLKGFKSHRSIHVWNSN